MALKKNEVRTGVFVLITLSLLVILLFALGAPGLMKPLKKFYIVFDNALGMKPGNHVLLAGRSIGQVSSLMSPIPMSKRPEKYKHYEVMVEIAVDKMANIYKQTQVNMEQVGLLGEQIIDFTRGDESTGLAEPGTVFIGTRPMRFTEIGKKMLDAFEPVATGAQSTLKEGKFTLVEGRKALQETRRMLAQLNGMTGKESPLTDTMLNAREFTDTIKRQPWRLIWRSTKEYPEEDESKKLKKEN